jgi:hypothetical protein
VVFAGEAVALPEERRGSGDDRGRAAGDIYVSVSVINSATAKRLGKGRRVSEDCAAGLVGFTIDFDVIGTPDGKGGVKQTGAPSFEAAITA